MKQAKPPAIPADARRRGHQASDPLACVWVSANAGAGKTFVLSRRVLRLLLAGHDPTGILCLTFTKTAATQMASRVFDELARWTTLSDWQLAEALGELEDKPQAQSRLAFARQLFARALETPGGLKVQTIHAFCERLLQQFPFEANVPGHFEIADEHKARALLSGAKAATLRQAVDHPDSRLGQAFSALVSLKGDEAIHQAIETLLAQRQSFMDMLRGAGGPKAASARLKAELGLGRKDTLEALAGRLVPPGSSAPCLGEAGFKALQKALAASPKTSDKELARRIEALFQATAPLAKIEAWTAIFTTKSGTARSLSRFVSKAVQEAHPALFAKVGHEFARLEDTLAQANALRTLMHSEALFTLTEAILKRYLQNKNRQGLLDYDDLITKTEALLTRFEAALWVQYKLDRGLSHILVDEAQDTSPAQWRVIQALSEAFFQESGEDSSSGAPKTRTLFAVGDDKQSIYSFQGAAPEQFEEQRRAFAKKAKEAQMRWRDVTLNLSFRSTQDILSAIDQVFAAPEMAASVSESGVPPHQAYRAHSAGEVQLWPLIAAESARPSSDWRQPVDQPAGALERLSGRIAAQIAEWIDSGATLAGGRAIKAGDCLILLRKRGVLMGLINRALQKAGLPVAGMDRLSLNAHIAVKDLILLGNTMLLPEDDLSLACLLKSPFFNLADEDLLALAPQRQGSLLAALQASPQPGHQAAYRRLAGWLSRVDFETPYSFFARILSADGGRKQLLERLGREAEDMIEAFLDQTLEYEARADDLSLQGFLAWASAEQSEVKRESEIRRNEARVMTVHGAKGLEAPIVFLVDDGGQPFAPAHHPTIFTLFPDKKPGPLMFWGARARGRQTALQSSLLQKSEQEALAEYRRLLYVAMTRAEDRLILCGCEPKSGRPEQSWHTVVEKALLPQMRAVKDKDQQVSHYLWRVSQPGQAGAPAQPENKSKNRQASARAPSSNSSAKPASLPAWALKPPAQAQKSLRKISPSLPAGGEEELIPAAGGPFPPPSGAGKEPSTALRRGQLIHSLLQYLPNLPPKAWYRAAQAYLKHALPEAGGANMAEDVLGCVMEVMRAAELAFVFGPHTRAEVPIAGLLQGRREVLSVSGKIDRLCAMDDGFLIVDFKTSRTPPQSVKAAPLSYINQMTLYRALMRKTAPKRCVKAAILWTQGPWLMPLTDELLDSNEAELLLK